jgi:polysaccharide export outer membrane protein
VLNVIQTEAQSAATFSRLAQVGPAAGVRVGPADTLSVTVFEAGSGGLFIPGEAGARPGNFIQIPTQELDRSGNITIPYGGTIRALGRTPRDIEKDIEERLKQRAIEPQAVVTIGERSSNVVSVLGAVRGATTIPLRPGGMRLLTAIARAGGLQFPAHESIVTIQRRGVTEQALMTAVVKNPNLNIQLAPEDIVYVVQSQRVFLAFGATPAPGSIGGQNNRRFLFEDDNLTLAEGLAKAGGLLSTTADPKSVFLFRYTPRDMLERAGVDVSRFAVRDVPTVYKVDVSEAEGFFLANQFYMKHKDIIFVSESPSTDLVKFLTIVDSVNGTVRGLIGTASDIKAITRSGTNGQ